VRLSWPAAAGQVRIRYGTRLPTWEVGEALPVTEAERYGREVVGAATVDGDRITVEADVPRGPQVYVPFAIGGTGAVMGRPVAVGQADPVRSLSARPIGGDLVLTWIWPPEIRLAQVEWTPSGGTATVRRVTRAQYVDGDGCRLATGSGGGTVVVRAVSIGPTGEALSPPAEVGVAAPATRLSYRVDRHESWRSRLGRRRVLTVRADTDCAGVDLVVVTASTLAMPLRPEQGTLLTRFDGLRLGRGTPVALEIELPAGLRKPYWLRCFVTAPKTVTLIDPPISQLKVA
jgi:hypothetical protein